MAPTYAVRGGLLYFVETLDKTLINIPTLKFRNILAVYQGFQNLTGLGKNMQPLAGTTDHFALDLINTTTAFYRRFCSRSF